MGGSLSSDCPLRIKHKGGYVDEYNRPVSAQEIMLRYPKHWLTRPDVFRAKATKAVIPPERVLLPGETFFLVPVRSLFTLMLRQGLSSEDFYSLLIRQGVSAKAFDDLKSRAAGVRSGRKNPRRWSKRKVHSNSSLPDAAAMKGQGRSKEFREVGNSAILDARSRAADVSRAPKLASTAAASFERLQESILNNSGATTKSTRCRTTKLVDSRTLFPPKVDSPHQNPSDRKPHERLTSPESNDSVSRAGYVSCSPKLACSTAAGVERPQELNRGNSGATKKSTRTTKRVDSLALFPPTVDSAHQNPSDQEPHERVTSQDSNDSVACEERKIIVEQETATHSAEQKLLKLDAVLPKESDKKSLADLFNESSLGLKSGPVKQSTALRDNLSELEFSWQQQASTSSTEENPADDHGPHDLCLSDSELRTIALRRFARGKFSRRRRLRKNWEPSLQTVYEHS